MLKKALFCRFLFLPTVLLPTVLLSTVLLSTVLLPTVALAADKKAHFTDGGTMQAVVSMGVGLLVVLALIFGCAWLMRRVNGLHGVNTSAMRIVSVLSVGQRERVLLLEIGGQQLLVGVTAHNVRTLHVFDEPVVSSRGPRDSDFASRLQAILSRKGFGSTQRESGIKGGEET